MPSPKLALAVLIVAVSACAAKPTQIDVPMEYRPTGVARSSVFSAGLPESRVFVEPFVDGRDNKDLIGENREDSPAIPVRPSGMSPAEFVQQELAASLRNAGLNLVDTRTEADRIVGGELLKFWCDETSLYRTEVRAVVTVRDRSGNVLWKGAPAGDAKRFGRSRSVGNYQQVYSDSMLKMFDTLFANEGFQQALSRKEPRARPEERRKKSS